MVHNKVKLKQMIDEMDEEGFLIRLKHALNWEFQHFGINIDIDELNNRVMVSFENSDTGFDIKVEKE